MAQIALHCSSFVGKACGYHPENTWEGCVNALSDWYSPPATFTERFDQLVQHVRSLGFEMLDIWQPGHLNWQWATDEQVAAARACLDQHHMTVSSYAGEFGVTRDEFLRACQIAKSIGAPLLSGTTELWFSDPGFVLQTLKDFDLRLALENHPETNAQQMLDQIGIGGDGRVGTAIDSGWYATRGYSVVDAVHALKGHILHVHLKDVLPGEAHINCGIGKGCVPMKAFVSALKSTGYSGVYSIENHTLDHDPDAELVEGARLVRQWLAAP